MLDFYHRRFNLLVCTTIIESGLDVPTANTIIIDRADRLGLAQLHQLRGRVGRSHHRAYAYLIVPPRQSMTRDAVKRLEAMARKMPQAPDNRAEANTAAAKRQFRANIEQVLALFRSDPADGKAGDARDRFLDAFMAHRQNHDKSYIGVIQSLPTSLSKQGTRWLDQIVEGLCRQAKKVLPALVLFNQ